MDINNTQVLTVCIHNIQILQQFHISNIAKNNNPWVDLIEF